MLSPFNIHTRPLLATSPEYGMAPAVYGLRIPQTIQALAPFDWLTGEDAARLARMASPTRRAQFAAGRWLLRHAASELFGGASCTIRTVDDRPRLWPSDGSQAAASIAHSSDRVVCAIGQLAAIGVDIERVRPRTDWNALCAWTVHAKERDRLGSGAPDWEGFYQLWTLKEALAKALGVGVFGLPFNEIAISKEGTIAMAPAECGVECRAWRLSAIECGPGFAGAVAWRP